MYRLRNLADETVSLESPSDQVLRTIRKLNPNVFVLGVVNITYNAPFFVTRFKEALFHFSALFDMLETNVERENEQRRLLEIVKEGDDDGGVAESLTHGPAVSAEVPVWRRSMT
ncbi:scarecrow-like protein 9 [Dendrobium catenatum]|uniref:scarecrow-like protein 9 n=1 Tax=Dendrobium catenatum TaxID=906689 RepID=UPI00109F236D|nr:scarecrow-like protein 9 [Dendrobium catenatum]